MLEADQALLKAIQTKLTNLVACVLNKAAHDAAFARELDEILLSDSLRKVIVRGKAKGGKLLFNPVAFLHEHGAERLRAELELKTDAELREIVRAQGVIKGAALRTAERQAMISELMVSAEHRLKQGASFL